MVNEYFRNKQKEMINQKKLNICFRISIQNSDFICFQSQFIQNLKYIHREIYSLVKFLFKREYVIRYVNVYDIHNKSNKKKNSKEKQLHKNIFRFDSHYENNRLIKTLTLRNYLQHKL